MLKLILLEGMNPYAEVIQHAFILQISLLWTHQLLKLHSETLQPKSICLLFSHRNFTEELGKHTQASPSHSWHIALYRQHKTWKRLEFHPTGSQDCSSDCLNGPWRVKDDAGVNDDRRKHFRVSRLQPHLCLQICVMP